MIKKILAAAMTVSMVLSFAVIPAHAASFSEANWVQYTKNDLKYQSGNMTSTVVEQHEIDGDNWWTHIKSVGSSKTQLTSNRTPIWYQAKNVGESPKYSHIRLYVGVYEDSDRTAMDKLWIRRCYKDSGESVNSFALCENGRAYPDGEGDLIVENYGTDFWSFRSDKDAEEYHKIDMICDHTGLQNPTGMTYLFIDGKYVGAQFNDSKKTELNHFYGLQLRWESGTNINTNSTVEAKFEEGREGHREYYNTDDYIVTLEDVMNDAGLGDAIDSKMIYKTSDMQMYMPGAEQNRTLYYTKSDGTKTSKSINEDITYEGNTATITHTATGDDWEKVGEMLSFYPYAVKNGRKTGVSYTSYHPRAKFIKISFDQQIETSSTWIGYDTFYSDNVEALQMWDNGGYLVIAVRGGGGNNTLNGNGGKALARMTDKNHIDWIIEPIDSEDNGGLKQYVYCNGVFVGEGKIGKQTACRINNILMYTKKDSVVKISDWSMTVYNGKMTMDDFEYNYAYKSGHKAFLLDVKATAGENENSGKFTISGLAKNTDSVDVPLDGTKIYKVVYDEYNNLLDFKVNNYIDGETFGNSFETDAFSTSYEEVAPVKARLIVWHPSKRAPYALVKELPLSFE